MSLKMKKILAVAAIVVIIAILAVVIILSNNNEKDNTAEQINLAKQYYEMMDYDKSAAIYNSLLKTNADEPDVYMGLYDIYMVMGREEKAIEILERGVQNTNNKAIEDKLAQMNGVDTSVEEPTETLLSEDTVSVMSVSESEISEVTTVETTTTTFVSEEETATETEETTETTEETTTSQTTTTKATTTQATTTTRPATTTTRRVTTTARPVVTTVRTTTTTAPVTTTKLTTTKKPEPVGEYDIKQRSVTDFVLTRDAVREQGIPSNAIINVIANNVTLSFNSSVFDEVYSINLSVALSHTTTKSTIKFKDNTLPCDVNVIVSSATMSDKTLELAHLFRNGTDYGKIKLSSKGYPMFTAKGGTYTIERVEEVTTAAPSKDDGIVVIGVGNIGKYKLTSDDVKGVGSNKIIKLKSINADVFLNSSVFNKTDEVDLGFTITNNSAKSVIEFNNSSSFGCEIKLVLTTCDMSSRNIAKAHIYRNGVDLGKVSVDSEGNPYFTATSGGKYVIMVPEE